MELTKEQLQKHGEVILAWANGAEVEVKEHIFGKWRGIDRPAFDTQYGHRVKPAPTYQERHDQWVKETGIKVGDTVWIVRGFESSEGGCDVDWNTKKALHVGKSGKVRHVNTECISVFTHDGSDWWNWPYFCLEPVKEPTYQERHAQWVKETGIKAGDKVKIVRGFENRDADYNFSMNREGEMDNLVGTIGVVADIYSYKINVKSGGRVWEWPYLCLEVIKPTYREFTMAEAEEHLLGAKVRSKDTGIAGTVNAIFNDTPTYYLQNYTYLDGSPCGMQETPPES